MINYRYKVNEEIARWVTEIFVRNKSGHSWWIAFTNPIAGPWKKMVAMDNNDSPVEVYRFERETERPDLVLVNDELKTILIVEAKDFLPKLIASSQMKKSLRVIEDMDKVLKATEHDHWNERAGYAIKPAFLWFCDSKERIAEEDKILRDTYQKESGLDPSAVVNIIISRGEDGKLVNNFFTHSGVSTELKV